MQTYFSVVKVNKLCFILADTSGRNRRVVYAVRQSDCVWIIIMIAIFPVNVVIILFSIFNRSWRKCIHLGPIRFPATFKTNTISLDSIWEMFTLSPHDALKHHFTLL